MTRPRGRPVHRKGVTRDDILATALTLLDEGGGDGLTLRALATRLGVTPMSLYHHVGDHAGLLRALSDRVYAQALEGVGEPAAPREEIQSLLTRYYRAVGRHPQLTLAIFATPEAFAGVTRQITDRLATLLAGVTAEPLLWRDILVDHTHGSGLALASAQGEQMRTQTLLKQYQLALDRLVDTDAALMWPRVKYQFVAEPKRCGTRCEEGTLEAATSSSSKNAWLYSRRARRTSPTVVVEGELSRGTSASTQRETKEVSSMDHRPSLLVLPPLTQPRFVANARAWRSIGRCRPPC